MLFIDVTHRLPIGFLNHAAKLSGCRVSLNTLLPQLLGECFAPMLQVGLAGVESHTIQVNRFDCKVNVRMFFIIVSSKNVLVIAK